MDIQIRQAVPEDLAEIVQIEWEIEPEAHAEMSVLQARLAMFQEGFLTAWVAGKLVGYGQSCIWDEKKPKFSPEKDFFSKKHNAKGKTLYIIFLGVRIRYQRQGIGSKLIQSLLDLARAKSLNKVHVVTWNDMLKLYTKQGFEPVAKMPNFLHDGEFTLLEYCLETGA